jgi:ABC-type glutathione transport system ATPase component
VRELDETTVLSIDDLLVEYPIHGGVVRAVDRAALEIRRGHRVAVVGESGSGKSTLALAILGLLEPPGRVAEPGEDDRVPARRGDQAAQRGHELGGP